MNLFSAWREFQKGKTKKHDVLAFAEHREEYLFSLAYDLNTGTYSHGEYTRFIVYDPKRRCIAKASVRDRVLHHAVHRLLMPFFDRMFIHDSFSSRRGKGVHSATKRFSQFLMQCSCNRTKTVYVLQLDIQKFFDSIDHDILYELLVRQIKDEKTCRLLKKIISSFEVAYGKGIPLGNLTSQLFSNVYLNELDQYVKRELRVQYYVRYADDIAIVSEKYNKLICVSDYIEQFLNDVLKLSLNHSKTSIRKWHNGIDFLGYIHFPHHKILRTKTKKRIFKKITIQNKASYFGVTSHARCFSIETRMRDILENK